jgi:hypothetical protein
MISVTHVQYVWRAPEMISVTSVQYVRRAPEVISVTYSILGEPLK